MAWKNLSEDVAELFTMLDSCVELSELGSGFHRHDYLDTSKLTTKETHTEETRRAKRQELERGRREYKAAKQREYKARKMARAA
jgi:phage protein D